MIRQIPEHLRHGEQQLVTASPPPTICEQSGGLADPPDLPAKRLGWNTRRLDANPAITFGNHVLELESEPAAHGQAGKPA